MSEHCAPNEAAASDASGRMDGARPVTVRRCPEEAELRITWDDGTVTALGYSHLRESCRCAHCRAGVTRVSGTSVALLEVEAFGDYALRLSFADGHDRGLYPFEYLRALEGSKAQG